LLYEQGANILHADQHQDHNLGLFFMRVEWALNGSSTETAFRFGEIQRKVCPAGESTRHAVEIDFK